MEFKKYIAHYNKLIFIIDEDLAEVGVNLYIVENNLPIKDYCQNNIYVCKEQAFEDYGVPIESWDDLTDLSGFPWL